MTIPENLKVLGDEGGLVFEEPWQARSFALVVALCRDGHYEWDDFRGLLIAEIGAAGDRGTGYFSHWLAASEKLLAARGLIAEGELTGRKADLKADPPHPTKSVPNPVYVDPGHR